jgi:hypothetical protein
MEFLDLYIFVLYAIQILLFLNLCISTFYRIFRQNEISILEKIKERKNSINFYFLILVSGLMMLIFNPFSSYIIEVKDELKDVLFNSAFIQLIYLLQKESTSL